MPPTSHLALVVRNFSSSPIHVGSKCFPGSGYIGWSVRVKNPYIKKYILSRSPESSGSDVCPGLLIVHNLLTGDESLHRWVVALSVHWQCWSTLHSKGLQQNCESHCAGWMGIHLCGTLRRGQQSFGFYRHTWQGGCWCVTHNAGRWRPWSHL